MTKKCINKTYIQIDFPTRSRQKRDGHAGFTVITTINTKFMKKMWIPYDPGLCGHVALRLWRLKGEMDLDLLLALAIGQCLMQIMQPQNENNMMQWWASSFNEVPARYSVFIGWDGIEHVGQLSDSNWTPYNDFSW